MHIQTLPDLQRPLVAKFYRTHRSAMRVKGQAQVWVARQAEIIAALCLTPVPEGQWLTGLFVSPNHRSQGIAGRLISAAIAQTSGRVWLFCDPQLCAFYQRLGFEPAEDLPTTLMDRLTRYRQTKPLVALGYTR